MAFGFSEVLLVALLGGPGASDLASVLPLQAYFQYRNIPLSVDKMVELAATTPTDGKTQLQQNLALRYLRENIEQVKTSPNSQKHREVIAEIAAGKKANDAQGFAKDQANFVLAQWDQKKIQAAEPESLKVAMLSWLPKHVTLAGGFRSSQEFDSNPGQMMELVAKQMPMQVRDHIYGTVEKLGNIRFDRAFYGYSEETKIIYGRIVGRFDPVKIVAVIAEAEKAEKQDVQTSRNAKGETLRVFDFSKRENSPRFAFIDDREFLFVASPGPLSVEAATKAFNEILAIREGEGKTAADSSLKEDVKKVPDKSLLATIGKLPSEASNASGIEKILVFAERFNQDIDFQVKGSGSDEGKVKSFTDSFIMGHKAALETWKNPRNPFPPGVPVQAIVNLLESVQIQSENTTVQFRAVLPRALLNVAPVVGVMP